MLSIPLSTINSLFIGFQVNTVFFTQLAIIPKTGCIQQLEEAEQEPTAVLAETRNSLKDIMWLVFSPEGQRSKSGVYTA